MGTLTLWAIVCGTLIVILSKYRLSVVRRHFAESSWVTVITAISLSSVLYVFFNFSVLKTSLTSNVLNVPDVRNAIFGIIIAVLTYLWFKDRGRVFSESARKFTDLHLVLLIVVTFVAVVTAELPGILQNFKISVGPGGVSLESREDREPKSISYSSGADQDAKGARLTSLDLLGWMTGLIGRDAKNVCELTKIPGKDCAAASSIRKYEGMALNTITPIFRCMVHVANKLRDRALADAFIRPVATSYMVAVLSSTTDQKSSTNQPERSPDPAEYVISALGDFEKQLKDYGYFAKSKECNEAGNISGAFKSGNENGRNTLLREILDLHRELPYGHIASAIFAAFFEDLASGIMILQQWEDQHSDSSEEHNGREEEALRDWTKYVVRSFQNFLISRIPDNILHIKAHHYKIGGRNILTKFRKDFVDALMDKNYCDGEINETLMRIYYLNIQESLINLEHALNGSMQGDFRSFSDRSVHEFKDDLAEYDRLLPCFKQIFRSAQLHKKNHALIHERIGDYKMRYADYIERREKSLHDEGLPRRLCREAGDHFTQAHAAMTAALRELPSPREKMLLRLLSSTDTETDARRISVKWNNMNRGRACER